jgi:DNA-binding XRE family transcriptional regulator
MNGDDHPLDYRQLGTSFDDLVSPFEASWTPELRQFGEELSAHFLFQSRLLELRRSLGLTQAEAGRVTGEAQSEISRMERGQVVPSVDRAVRIIARLKAHDGAGQNPTPPVL